MNASTREEQLALEEFLLPMLLEDYLRELGDLKTWRQEIADRHSGFDLPAAEAAAYQRLDRVIGELSKVLVA